ncbi:MAG: 16S rRNA (uracil(1498)-N(3))-methyltransferase [Chlorobiaceae bacterium]
MELFYTARQNIDLNASSLVVDGDEFHHLIRVLRKKKGEMILVTDGNGLSCKVQIVEVGQLSLEGKIITHSLVERPKTNVTVALSLLKNPQRFEWFLEKSTELGISSIIPMITLRTFFHPLSREKVQSRLKRWNSIVLSAARQSKRYYLPQLIEPISFSQVCSLNGYDFKLIPYELSKEAPVVYCSGKNTIFMIGGEGGFTADEIQAAKSAGFYEISLGQTILRAETAGVFVVAMVRAQLFGEMSQRWF